jgi:hypothetical protein
MHAHMHYVLAAFVAVAGRDFGFSAAAAAGLAAGVAAAAAGAFALTAPPEIE